MTPQRLRIFSVRALCTMALAMFAAAIAAPTAGFADDDAVIERADARFLRQLDEAIASGEITREFALQQKFYYVFEPEEINHRFRVENATPMKCATNMVREFMEMRDRVELTSEVVEELQAYLDRSDPRIAAGKTDDPQNRVLATYDSPGGNFRLTYFTTGTNAVPVADVDPANGIPDFVEWCATYCDSSWQREIVELEFQAPLLDGSGKYQIGFEQMGAYGYATTNGMGGTRIVLHRNFLGFPQNSDPDGDQKGAAKSTVAHEFKHASQYQGSNWSEGNWVELDASWVEDAVYDSTNDYYNFIQSANGIRAPAQSLDSGGGGLYEDCIWQRFMTDTWGERIIYEIWERRKTNQTENMKVTYDVILQQFNSSFPLAYEEFMEWCYLSGVRASSELTGFRERWSYPNSQIAQTNTVLPLTRTGTIVRNAANFVILDSNGLLTGLPHVSFTSAIGSPLQLRVIYTNLAGQEDHEEIVLDANGAAEADLTHWLQDLDQVAILIINPKRDGGVDPFSITVTAQDLTGLASDESVGAAPARFALEQNSPNPARAGTTFRFSLAQDSRVQLGVYDLAGRLVATLADRASFRAGAHQLAWDGRNDAGVRVASGVYAYKIVAGNFSETKKLMLVR
ncbi:MAG: MXAN_6640 family putative metalloprotease [bacterium]